jgi:hypothetical protein
MLHGEVVKALAIAAKTDAGRLSSVNHVERTENSLGVQPCTTQKRDYIYIAC